MLNIEFSNEIDIGDSDAIYIFPFRTDVERILERVGGDFSLIGWNIISLREFTEKVHFEFFPEIDKLEDATRFAIVHRILLESDFLKDFEQHKRKTGIAESLVDLFAILDESGILAEDDIEKILPNTDERTRASIRLYKIFRDELSQRKLVTSGDIYINISSEISEGNIPKILSNKKKIVFVNFLEFNIPQKIFIKSLAEKFDVFINFQYSRNIFPKNWREPIEKIAIDFDIELKFPDIADGHWLSAALDGYPENANVALSAADDGIPDFALLEIPDVRREVELVAKIAKILSINNKISSDEIFIITPNPERYASLLANALERAKIEYSFDNNIAHNYDIYELFRRIIVAIKTDWRRQELFDLLKHPILRWQFSNLEELERYSVRNRMVNKENWLHCGFEDFAPIKNLIESLDFLSVKCKASDIIEILVKVEKTVKLTEFPDEKGDRKIIIQRQWETILTDGEKLAKGYGDLEELSGIELFSALIHISKSILLGENRANFGIRILNNLEGRNNRGALAFYIGFGKNNFPIHKKKNVILMQNYDEFLPFVPDKMWVNNLSLILGLMSAEKFYLMYPLHDGEMDVGCSQPIDEIFRFCKSGDIERKIPDAADIFKALRKYELTKFDYTFNRAAEIQQGITTISENFNFQRIGEKLSGEQIGVRELETYWECPMRYFFEKTIGIPEPEPETETLSYAELGTAIHKALELFYRNRYKKILGETPPKFHPNDLSSMDKILHSYYEKINKQYSYLINNIAISNDILYNSIDELSNYIAMQIDITKWNDKKIPFSKVDELEYAKGFTDRNFARNILEREIELSENLGVKNLPFLFELPLIVTLNVDDKIVKISGRIDRIDMLADGSLILIDYKTGGAKGLSSKNNSKIGKLKLDKEIQLQIYALLLHTFGFDVSGLAYISHIRDWNGPYVDFVKEIDIEGIGEKVESIIFEFCSGYIDSAKDKNNCKYCPYVEQCELVLGRK